MRVPFPYSYGRSSGQVDRIKNLPSPFNEMHGLLGRSAASSWLKGISPRPRLCSWSQDTFAQNLAYVASIRCGCSSRNYFSLPQVLPQMSKTLGQNCFALHCPRKSWFPEHWWGWKNFCPGVGVPEQSTEWRHQTMCLRWLPHAAQSRTTILPFNFFFNDNITVCLYKSSVISQLPVVISPGWLLWFPPRLHSFRFIGLLHTHSQK